MLCLEDTLKIMTMFQGKPPKVKLNICVIFQFRGDIKVNNIKDCTLPFA